MALRTMQFGLVLALFLLAPASLAQAGPAQNDLTATDGSIQVGSGSSTVFDPASKVTGDYNPRTVTASDPQHGSISVNPSSGEITYTANAGYEGSDSFTYSKSEADWPDELDRKFVLPAAVSSARNFDIQSRKAYNTASTIDFGPDGSALPFPDRGVCTVYTVHTALNLFVAGNGSYESGQTLNVAYDTNGISGVDEVKTLNAWSLPSQYTSTVHGVSYQQLDDFSPSTMSISINQFVSNSFGRPEARLSSESSATKATGDSFLLRARPVYNSEPAGCIDESQATVTVNVLSPGEVLAATTTNNTSAGSQSSDKRAFEDGEENLGTNVNAGRTLSDTLANAGILGDDYDSFNQQADGTRTYLKPLLLTLNIYALFLLLWFIGWRRYRRDR